MTPKQELSAGGVVVREGARGPEVLLIKDHRSKWTFPKGHVEVGEVPEAAALRETAEETGLTDLSAVGEIGVTRYFFKDKWGNGGDLIHKTVRYFLLAAPKDAAPRPPQDWSHGTEPITDAKWFSFPTARQRSGYKDNLRLLAAAEQALTMPRRNQPSLFPAPTTHEHPAHHQ
jgi:8-oxo-dGTP pyrophosphatase MutT (NUDIX family)